jgi:AsmA protein
MKRGEVKMLDKIKKIGKWAGIVVGGIIVVLIIAAIALPYFLPLDRIKDIAAQKASEAINRQVKIGKVSFNIFKGIEIRNVSVSNRPGFSKEPFISAGLIELKYDFFALLKGKVAIDKIVLVKPEILVEQKNGVSNYSDLIGVKKPAPQTKKPEPKKAGKKKEPVSIMVSKFSIKDAKLLMVSYVNGQKKVTGLKDLNVNISGISLKTVKPISLYVGMKGLYEGKEVPITVSGKIKFDLSKSYVNIYDLDISAAGEKLTIGAEVKSFDKAPNINLSVSSRKIDVDKFLAIVSGTGSKKPKTKTPPAPYGQQTRNIDKSLKSIPLNIKVAAKIDLQNILFKEMRIDSVAAKIGLSNKLVNIDLTGIKAYRGAITGNIKANLNVSGISYTLTDVAGKNFDANPASNDVIESFLTKLPDYKDLKDKISGNLGFRISLTGRGVETPDIIANANGKGSFILANGKISKLKSLSAVGEKIGLTMLSKDLDLKEFKANFSIANKIATISNMALHNGDEGDIKLTFNGSANISSLEFIKGNTLALKLNPRTTKLSSEYDPFKDELGWYALDFEMTGSLKKPIPIPKLGKPIQQIFDTKKKQLEDAAQKELDRQKKEAEDKARQELEDKAKELLKF